MKIEQEIQKIKTYIFNKFGEDSFNLLNHEHIDKKSKRDGNLQYYKCQICNYEYCKVEEDKLEIKKKIRELEKELERLETLI